MEARTNLYVAGDAAQAACVAGRGVGGEKQHAGGGGREDIHQLHQVSGLLRHSERKVKKTPS